MIVFLRSKIIVKIVGTAVHRESTTGQQFPWYNRRICVTKVCHHTRLSIQLIGPEQFHRLSKTVFAKRTESINIEAILEI